MCVDIIYIYIYIYISVYVCRLVGIFMTLSALMNEFGLVSICGCISQYNLEERDKDKGYQLHVRINHYFHALGD